MVPYSKSIQTKSKIVHLNGVLITPIKKELYREAT